MAKFWYCDISDVETMKTTAEDIEKTFGTCSTGSVAFQNHTSRELCSGEADIVVCNAAILSFTSFMEISNELLRKCLDVNIFGTINVSCYLNKSTADN